MNIILLGGTGSIGSMSLDLISEYNHTLLGVSLGSDINKSLELVKKFNPTYICLRKEEDKAFFKNYPNVFVGDEGLKKLASIKCDLLINALSGSVGLVPMESAIKAGNDIALANKESLVMAGNIIMNLKKKYRINIYPIDSEHNAIWQALNGEDINNVETLYITASGGALREYKREDLENITPEVALNHPNWSMGSKITIDCATMMNKGLEVIEAHYLFNMPYRKIKPIMHKESICHALVLFNDSSIKAVLAPHDMKIPILYALNKGKRVDYDNKLKLTNMHFKSISTKRFPLLKVAIEAGKKGGIAPTVLCASNEAAVKLFLDGKIKFLDIEKIVKNELKNMENFNPTIDDILRVDKEIKERLFGGRY